jgi:iron complex outermembrane receptor protein
MDVQLRLRGLLACGVSFMALGAAGSALAADAAAADAATASEVVVTGSRTITNGASAPTPVAVVSSTQLTSAQPGNLADAVMQLPVFMGSFKATAAGSNHSATGAGANLLALRGLGPSRTLVLLDGRRVTPTTINGTTDANLIPSSLLSRVDVVTGGASAAYGSDAVAGVVNFILDSKFDGVKASLQGGESGYQDAQSIKGNLTYGGAFLGDKLHIVASGDYYKLRGIDLDVHGRDWASQGYGLIPVSATSANLIIARDVRDSNGSFGGTITGCQPAGALCPINRMQFTPGGTLIPFVNGSNVSSAVMSGGDGTARRTNLVPGLETKIFFGRASYDVNDQLSLFAEVNYGKMHSDYAGANDTNQGTSNSFTIFNDNAYLSPALKAQMAANGVTSFTLQRVDGDFGLNRYFADTEAKRVVVGFQGGIGATSWKYSGYAQFGDTKTAYQISNNLIEDHSFNGADAVINPATGQIVCRSTLLNTVAGAGCVPINVLGNGAPSAAAVAYATGTSNVLDEVKQTVLSIDMRGDWFKLWSDPVSIAFGAEYRKEQGEVTEDALSAATRNGAGIKGYPAAQQGLFGGYLYSIDGLPLKGDFDVKEAFIEANVPLLKDQPLIYRLDLNGAVRYANYSTAGGQTTWKIGGVWQPIEDLRFRATRSRDIRAPNIQELFTVSNQINGQPVSDPQLGGARFIAIQRQTGNANLSVEEADSKTVGVVWRPSFLSGLTASIDYYSISINNVIALPTAQQVVDSCGLTSCPNVLRNAADNSINVVITPYTNFAKLRTSGEDFEVDYVTSFQGGSLSLRGLATHTEELSTTLGTVTTDRVGDLNVGPPSAADAWTGSFNVDWRNDHWHLYVQERYLGSGHLDHTVTYDPSVNTHIPAVYYTDLTVGYAFPARGVKYEVYGTINNLFDKDPPITPNGASTTPRAANGGLYDFLGRYFTMGVRAQF